MKKRMWLWCLIAAFGMSIVACGGDDEKETPTPPQTGGEQTPVVPPTDGQQTPPSQSVIVVDTMEVIANVEEVPYTGGTIEFVTKTNVVYSVDTDQEWIKITSDGRALTAEYTVTATVDANEGEAREGVITVTFEDEATTVKTVTVKQAAKPAEDPEPTQPDPTVEPTAPAAETVTVTLNIYPGAAGTTVEATAVAAKLGVEDVAAAIADGTVKYVGLNADGTVYTAADGSTPAFTTNGPVGHWYNSECNPIVWGTPDPAGTGAVRLAYLEGDGATFNLGYDNSGNFVAGDAYKIAGKYINGDVEVIFEVAINVIEAPESSFVAPEADYVLDVQVVQDNGWGATYFALDGTDITGLSKYESANAYENPAKGVSVDITAEIEAALGLEIGELENSINEGSVYLGSYNANNEFMDCYEVHGSNYFFWYDADGSALTQYGGYACIDNIGFVGEAKELRLYGTTCLMPNKAEIGTTYATYIVFKTAEAEYVVQINQEVVAVPSSKDFQVVYTKEKAFTMPFVEDSENDDPTLCSLEEDWADIVDAIGGNPDLVQMSKLDENSETIYQGYSNTDGWFGATGAAAWGTGANLIFMQYATNDSGIAGTFRRIGTITTGITDGMTAECTYRYVYTETGKAADITFKVTFAVAE